MNQYNSLVIRFIRDSKNDQNDDVIRVNPIWRTLSNDVSILEYNIQTTFKNLQSPMAVTQKVLSSTLLVYLQSIFQLYVHDNDPFESVQIDFPNAPTILLSLKELSKRSDMILELIRTSITSWPQKPDIQSQKLTLRQHVFYDDTGREIRRSTQIIY